MERATLLPNLGAVGSAIASAFCCLGPIVYVSLGLGAGLASTFEPLRPWFLGAAVLSLGAAFHGAYARPSRSCQEGGTCETAAKARRKRKRQKVVLWISAALVALFATLPTWSAWLT